MGVGGQQESVSSGLQSKQHRSNVYIEINIKKGILKVYEYNNVQRRAYDVHKLCALCIFDENYPKGPFNRNRLVTSYNQFPLVVPILARRSDQASEHKPVQEEINSLHPLARLQLRSGRATPTPSGIRPCNRNFLGEG
jgi:hypothetical protein